MLPCVGLTLRNVAMRALAAGSFHRVRRSQGLAPLLDGAACPSAAYLLRRWWQRRCVAGPAHISHLRYAAEVPTSVCGGHGALKDRVPCSAMYERVSSGLQPSMMFAFLAGTCSWSTGVLHNSIKIVHGMPLVLGFMSKQQPWSSCGLDGAPNVLIFSQLMMPPLVLMSLQLGAVDGPA
eukprot:scaffold184776_cov18-Tisochrysis_lutea.AAC.1